MQQNYMGNPLEFPSSIKDSPLEILKSWKANPWELYRKSFGIPLKYQENPSGILEEIYSNFSLKSEENLVGTHWKSKAISP